jgi:hypothetical protein
VFCIFLCLLMVILAEATAYLIRVVVQYGSNLIRIVPKLIQ